MKSRAILLIIAGLLLATGCRRQRAHIVVKDAAVSAWDDGATVAVQLQFANDGRGPAYNVRLTRVDVPGGTYAGPTGLPTPALGNLAIGQDDLIFDALLTVPADGSTRTLLVEGTYSSAASGGDERRFRAERPIRPDTTRPGPVPGTPGQTSKQTPNTATYPPAPPPQRGRPNSESPVFVPLGPPRQLFAPTPTGTALGTTAGGAAVRIPVNTSTLTNAGTPPDPNAAAASADGVVLATYNTGISFSTNGGQTFTDINLFSPQPGNPARTSFFPQSDGGLCCDQVVIYVPGANIFVWLLQYNPVVNPTTNLITQASRLRIAWATPAAVAADFWNAWVYADLTGINVAGVSSGLGISNNEWLDYPDLAFSNTFLYVGVDHGFTTPGLVYGGRRIVARMSLADMANPAATVVNYAFGELTGSNGLNKTHFVQGTRDRMVVGSLDNGSTMRVFTWVDTEGAIRAASTVGISQIAQGASYTSLAPDNSDWLAVSFPGNITGGVYRSVGTGLGSANRDEFLFAFDAGANAAGSRPRAYLRLETLTPNGNNYDVFAEYDVWNNDYAFAMGGLGTDGYGIGVTLAVGGGTIGYPQFAVGFKDDFVVYQVTSSNATQTVRFGDYVSNRPTFVGLFVTEVYDVILNPLPAGVTSGTCATVGCSARMRFVEYGRPPPPPIN